MQLDICVLGALMELMRMVFTVILLLSRFNHEI